MKISYFKLDIPYMNWFCGIMNPVRHDYAVCSLFFVCVLGPVKQMAITLTYSPS